MNITKRTLAFNGLKQFFVHTYYSDGSASSSGPFATAEEAVAEIDALNLRDAEEAADAAYSELFDDSAMIRWAEMGGYASGLARPVAPHERKVYEGWEDIPY